MCIIRKLPCSAVQNCELKILLHVFHANPCICDFVHVPANLCKCMKHARDVLESKVLPFF